MLIEISGCTGTGKTTISNLVMRNLIALKVNAKQIDVGGKFSYDFIAFPWFLWYASRHASFSWNTFKSLIRDADSKFTALNSYRNFAKKIGIFQLLRTRQNRHEIILDEGTVHAIHNLFVHVNSTPRVSDITNYVNCVPIPDLLVYVRASLDTIVSRTIKRGHRRAGNDEHDVRAFVANAIASFEILTSLDVIKERLIVVENEGSNYSEIDRIAKSITKQIILKRNSRSSI